MISSQHAMELLRRLNQQRVTGKLQNFAQDIGFADNSSVVLCSLISYLKPKFGPESELSRWLSIEE